MAERDRTPIYVEYHDGHPFDVITANGDRYDFEHCKRDGITYYTLSGCFGQTLETIGAPRFCEPKKMVHRVRIWVRGGRLADERGRTVRKHEARGYRLLKRLPSDPFVGACEGTTVYCQTCDDRLPDDTDRPCKHVWWCDDCLGWGGAVDEPLCKDPECSAPLLEVLHG